jgi:uroporphyrinogen decarboxylase
VLEYSPDAVFLSSNLAYKSGLAMNMELAEEFVLKGLQDQAAVFNSRKIPVILHSDGDNSDLMDIWINMGIKAIHPNEPCSRISIYDTKNIWGDQLCLMGNIDVSILADPEVSKVRKATHEHLEKLSVNGGYICGSSHDVDDNCRLENLAAMIDTVNRYKVSV